MKSLASLNKKTSIFILDDDRFYLEFLKNSINKNIPNTLISIFSDRFSLYKYLEQKPDYILLDYQLGIENQNKITAHQVLNTIEEINPNQKIIFMSGTTNPELLDEYNQYRNINYLLKNSEIVYDLKKMLSIQKVLKNEG